MHSFISEKDWYELMNWIDNGLRKEFVDVFDYSSFNNLKTTFVFSKKYDVNEDISYADFKEAQQILRIAQKDVLSKSNKDVFLDIEIESLILKKNKLQIAFYDKSNNKKLNLSKDEFGMYLTKIADLTFAEWLKDTSYYPHEKGKINDAILVFNQEENAKTKLNKAQAIIKTLSGKEIDYLNEKHQNANGSKKMVDLILELDKNKQQLKIQEKTKEKERGE